MSSIPGYTLELYVEWLHDLVIEKQTGPILSLRMAEMLTPHSARRKVLTEEQFAGVIAFYEPHRESIENWLSDFDEEKQGWRSYSGYREDLTPIEEFQVMVYIDYTTRAFPLLPPIGTLGAPSYFVYQYGGIPNHRFVNSVELTHQERLAILREFSPVVLAQKEPECIEAIITKDILDLYHIPTHRDPGATLFDLMTKVKSLLTDPVVEPEPHDRDYVNKWVADAPRTECECSEVVRYREEGTDAPVDLWSCGECNKRFIPGDEHRKVYDALVYVMAFVTTASDHQLMVTSDKTYQLALGSRLVTSPTATPLEAVLEWARTNPSMVDAYINKRFSHLMGAAGQMDSLTTALEQIATAIEESKNAHHHQQ